MVDAGSSAAESGADAVGAGTADELATRGLGDGVLVNLIVNELVVASLSWQKECQKLKKTGKRDTAARPAKTVLQIPLKSAPPAGEPSPERSAEDQHPNLGLISYQNLETIYIYTPPQSCAAAAREPESDSELNEDFRGVPRRLRAAAAAAATVAHRHQPRHGQRHHERHRRHHGTG